MHMFRAGRKNLLQGRLRQVIAIKAANPRRAWVTTIEGLSHVVGAKAEEDKKKTQTLWRKLSHRCVITLYHTMGKMFDFFFVAGYTVLNKCDQSVRSFGPHDFVICKLKTKSSIWNAFMHELRTCHQKYILFRAQRAVFAETWNSKTTKPILRQKLGHCYLRSTLYPIPEKKCWLLFVAGYSEPSATNAFDPSGLMTLLCELKTKSSIWSAFDAWLATNS